MNLPPLLLFGAGGHAKVVLDALEGLNDPPMLVLDDAPRVPTLLGYQIVKNTPEIWKEYPSFRFHIALGQNKTRARLFGEFLERGGTPKTVIHPSAVVSRHAKIQEGCFVAGGAVINPGAVIGKNSIINTAASVDHDCVLGQHVHICPGVHLAGNVSVGEGTMIGTGTSVIPGITIGTGVTIGAGSAVVRDIEANAVAYGVPARTARQ